ncbi:MAG TPA: NmrA family NAD(P)-binding protein [Opitutaceae bacterium]|nr:NmrA family NAD(P)-binding protein [Opitutaceae bacterium]
MKSKTNPAMYVITGITGQVGGAVARTLLANNQPVRAVVRDAAKGAAWTALGCEVALADMNDTTALTAAFKGAAGVFFLLPPTFDPTSGFPEARAQIEAAATALRTARPAKVVCISTVGAQATQTNLLTQLTLLEKEFSKLPMPVTFLRPGWYMENSRWDIAPAAQTGVFPSFLQPLDKPVPMVATADVGRTAAELLLETGSGQRFVELEGPRRVTPNEIAVTLAWILGRPVRTEIVPRVQWADLFKSQGMKNPEPRMRMIDGFNEGWIEFTAGPTGTRKGATPLETVLRDLVGQTAAQVTSNR